MRYISTRGAAPVLPFAETMLTGLARDGGLYVPETVPTLSPDQIAAFEGISYEDAAFRVMQPFVAESFSETELREAIRRAYQGFGHAARAPLVQLAPGHFLLELFHGPTLAFKDFAMQLIGQLFQIALAREGRRVTIVGATSGDTGSAAIEAFRGLPPSSVMRTGAPSRSRSVPSTTTRSPTFSPSVTTVRTPSASPSLTGRTTTLSSP